MTGKTRPSDDKKKKKLPPANAIITIPKFGSMRVNVTAVSHGISVVQYSTSGQTRTQQAFYPAKRTSGSFELDLAFATYKGYESAADWLTRYQMWAANPKSRPRPARVLIPSRNFDKIGVLEGGVTYGDTVGAIVRRMQLAFVGSRDPLLLNSNNRSEFLMPDTTSEMLTYLYPGSQVKGKATDSWDQYDETVSLDSVLLNEGLDYEFPEGTGGMW